MTTNIMWKLIQDIQQFRGRRSPEEEGDEPRAFISPGANWPEQEIKKVSNLAIAAVFLVILAGSGRK